LSAYVTARTAIASVPNMAGADGTDPGTALFEWYATSKFSSQQVARHDAVIGPFYRREHAGEDHQFHALEPPTWAGWSGAARFFSADMSCWSLLEASSLRLFRGLI
jgi:hypothetical protein